MAMSATWKRVWLTWTLVAGAVLISFALLITSIDDVRYLRQRQTRKRWCDEQCRAAQANLNHLIKLAGLSYDNSSATEDWQRATARTLVCQLTRLPGEPLEIEERGLSTGVRWDKICAYLKTCPEVFEFDSSVGVWTARESAECP